MTRNARDHQPCERTVWYVTTTGRRPDYDTQITRLRNATTPIRSLCVLMLRTNGIGDASAHEITSHTKCHPMFSVGYPTSLYRVVAGLGIEGYLRYVRK